MAKEKAGVDVRVLSGIQSVMDFWAHRVPVLAAVRAKDKELAAGLENLGPYDLFLRKDAIIAAITEGD